ncbi:MAG: molybdopterin cofactor-binding domain-containing protein, partial [Hyphomicrobiales bacterium]
MTAFNGRPAADYLSDSDTVVVARTSGPGKDELFIAIAAQGMVTAFNGHVDLGTGIRTSLAQIVAEELDVPFDQVCMVLGGTSATPN